MTEEEKETYLILRGWKSFEFDIGPFKLAKLIKLGEGTIRLWTVDPTNSKIIIHPGATFYTDGYYYTDEAYLLEVNGDSA